MGEDLCCGGPAGRSAAGQTRAAGRGRRERCGCGFGPVESLPDALEGPVAPRAVDGADGGGDAAGDGALEEAPQGAVVRLRRRILSASQTLKVRPQPGRAWRLLQKIRRARRVFRWGLLSSKP